VKAFQITAPDAWGFKDMPQPEPGNGEALLRIEVVGFCGSDLNTYRGLNPLVQYPRIPGHEIGAVIEGFGAGAPESLAIGQAVTVSPYSHCGRCAACRHGRVNCCRDNQTLGVQRDGAFARYLTVPCDKLLAADGLSLAELALVEPLTIGAHAAARGRVAAGETVTVLGCGAIGLGAVAGSARRGGRVIAVDLDDAKLDLARACGAAETINTRTADLHERLLALTAGHGPEVVVEAIGLPQTFRAAVEEVCFAGRVVYIGYAKAPVEYETKLFILKELDILGSRNALRDDFGGVIAMLESESFPVNRVITSTVPFEQAGKALAAWSADPSKVTKIQVRLS